MRSLIVVTVVATATLLFFFVGSRGEPEIPVDLHEAQQQRSATKPYIDQQSQPMRSGVTKSDAQVSNEREIAIHWYEPPQWNFLSPNGSSLENYEFYKLLAESGDGLAAYKLANMMSSCDSTFLNREGLDKAVIQMRHTFTYYDPALEAKVRIGEPEKVNEYIERSIEHFESCTDFSAEQREEHQKWLELAVNNGHTTAMLDYGRNLDDPVASVELYRSAWRKGDGWALRSLAEGLEQIYDEGIDPNAKIPAFAAMHAYVMLLRTAHGANPERVVGRLTLRNQAKLDEMAKEMLPREFGAAVELSRQLIVSNENCCYSM